MWVQEVEKLNLVDGSGKNKSFIVICMITWIGLEVMGEICTKDFDSTRGIGNNLRIGLESIGKFVDHFLKDRF
jgi:hypothetical protein